MIKKKNQYLFIVKCVMLKQLMYTLRKPNMCDMEEKHFVRKVQWLDN